MSHRSFERTFNGGNLSREPTLAERIALTLMLQADSERRRDRPPITLRKFSWEQEQ